MQKSIYTATLTLLVALFSPFSVAEGQVNMRMILEQILQNANGGPNGVQPQFPQPPVFRQPPTIGQPPTIRQPPAIGQPPVTLRPPSVQRRGMTPVQGSVQNYVLTAGGIETAATFDGNKLMIYSDGVGYRYVRRPEMDTRDGQFLGFSNQALDKSIRFPINGGNRMQIAGPRNTWMWSQMKVKKAVAPVAAGDLHAQIDALAFKIQDQARQLASEANMHYRNSPHYGHLIADTSAMLKQSMHMHEVAHVHGDLNQLGEDLAELDKSFHHLEDTFDEIERDASRGRGQIQGHTAHVKELLEATESNIHHLSSIVASVSQPVITGPPSGTFSDIGGLSHQLEEATNDLLLDMHFNYSHNRHFKLTYKETYSLLTAAQQVHAASRSNRRTKIRRTLKGLDGLTSHLSEDIRNWTCQARYRCGDCSLNQKLSRVQWILADLMHDAGVAPTELSSLAGRNLPVAPLKIAPRPR